jgi:hypothetical protein
MAPNSVAFNINKIKSDVPQHHIADDSKVISVAHLQLRENRNDLEDTVLALKVLNCTVGGANTHTKVATNSSQAYKKQKMFSAAKSYNRYFLCADLKHPPFCCAIMTKSTAESAELLCYNHGDVFIGADFYVVEPNLTFQTIGESVAVLSLSTKQLIPLKDCENADSQAFPMTLPPHAGDTHYFIIEGKEINLRRINLPTDVSCSGIQCDRQKTKGGCSCIHNGPGQAMVYAFDVDFPISRDLQLGTNYTCDSYRSYRTTSLFFQNFADHANNTLVEQEFAERKERRASIKKMVHYINKNGGWKVVGWCKRGEVADAANETEKVENNEVNFHISYLYPFNTQLVNSQEFKELQITSNSTPLLPSTEMQTV